jgi:integrase
MERERDEFYKRFDAEKADRGATTGPPSTTTLLYGVEGMELPAPLSKQQNGVEWMDLSEPSQSPLSKRQISTSPLPLPTPIVRQSNSAIGPRPTVSTAAPRLAAAAEKQPSTPGDGQKPLRVTSQQQGTTSSSTSQRSATPAKAQPSPPTVQKQSSAAAAPPSGRSAAPVTKVDERRQQQQPAASANPPPRPATTRPPRAEEKQPQSLMSTRHESRGIGAVTVSTVLHEDEIADLKRFHDNSLAASTRKAYRSDYDSLVKFLEDRFPEVKESQIQAKCTLEHVLAYLNQLCNDGKKLSTINRRLSTIKKHILPSLFHKAVVPGSREEEIGREMDAIVRGMRRTIGAEQRVRGKRPLVIENIIAMCDIAGKLTGDSGATMPNKRCRDVCLLLFMFFSAMRRNEVVQLQWSDLTFDARGVVVNIQRSKTDKESKGHTIALSRLVGERTAYCPVKALEVWRDRSKGAGESPVFRWISKKDQIQWRLLIDQRIVAIVKYYAGQIGLDPTCFAAHSTRSGYVTCSSDRGVPISEIMKRTRHKSISSVAVYMKSEDLFSGSGDSAL